MKIEKKEVEPDFKPVEVKLTLETEEEVKALQKWFGQINNFLAKADETADRAGYTHAVNAFRGITMALEK